MGYHRRLTHRSYKTPKDRVFLSDLRDAGIGRRTHVLNCNAPHPSPDTPRDGEWWSYIGWMLVGEGTHCNIEQCSHYAPDVCSDGFLVWLSKYHYVPLAILNIVLLALGGLPFLLWGVFIRVTIGLDATWMVNSLTHYWGSRSVAPQAHVTEDSYPSCV